MPIIPKRKFIPIGIVFLLIVFGFTGCAEYVMPADLRTPHVTHIRGKGMIDKKGGQVIVMDKNSETYGNSVVIPEGAVDEEIEVEISVDKEENEIEKELNDYVNFEPKWIRFDPVDAEFDKAVTLGLTYDHLPHESIWYMKIIEYISDTVPYVTHTMTDKDYDEKVLFFEVYKFGIFAIYPE